MIRKVLPNIIAQDITGVQPMYADVAEVLSTNLPTFNKKYWPHQMTLDSWENAHLAVRWCYTNLKSRNWRSVGRHFVFKRHDDATMFALRWL